MSVIITKLDETDYSTWNDFLHESPQESFLYTTEWATLISYVFNRHFDIIAALKNDRIVGGCVVFIRRKWGSKMLTPVPFYPYNGPVFAIAADAKYQKTIASQLDITEKLARYLNLNYQFWILDTSQDIIDMRGFQWSGCHLSPSYNYLLNLGKWEVCQENFNQNVRKKIRHAENAGLSIEQSRDKQTIIDLYLKSYKRHNLKPLVAESSLQHFLDMVLKLPQAKLYYCHDKANILAGRLILKDKHTLYDVLAGSADTEGLASTFLVYNILKMHSDDNNVFNFLGADHPQIEEFKRGFGGELVNGYRVTGPLSFPMNIIVKWREKNLKRNREL
jgi:hypothetical protein